MIFTTPRSEEYRLFRRINDGPYTLVGQGAAAYAAGNPVNAIRREDEALPMTSCTICYYAQTVDRDGNASALVRLEPCIERKAPTLPKPRLSPPAAIGTNDCRAEDETHLDVPAAGRGAVLDHDQSEG